MLEHEQVFRHSGKFEALTLSIYEQNVVASLSQYLYLVLVTFLVSLTLVLHFQP